MKYFHGTPDKNFDPSAWNPSRGRFDLCLVPDRDVALGYAEEMGGGHVVEFELKYSPDPVWIALRALDKAGYDYSWIDVDGPYVYLLFDEIEVQDILEEAGIYAIEYEDEDWSNKAHTCVRVFNPEALA